MPPFAAPAAPATPATPASRGRHVHPTPCRARQPTTASRRLAATPSPAPWRTRPSVESDDPCRRPLQRAGRPGRARHRVVAHVLCGGSGLRTGGRSRWPRAVHERSSGRRRAGEPDRAAACVRAHQLHAAAKAADHFLDQDAREDQDTGSWMIATANALALKLAAEMDDHVAGVRRAATEKSPLEPHDAALARRLAATTAPSRGEA